MDLSVGRVHRLYPLRRRYDAIDQSSFSAVPERGLIGTLVKKKIFHFGVRSRLLVWRGDREGVTLPRFHGSFAMPCFEPELISTMRAALDDVMSQIPVEQSTFGIKVHFAEFILKAAADGQTSYDALLAAATSQIQTVLSMLT